MTRMPWGASSTAKASISDLTAPLDAAYAATGWFDAEWCAVMDEMNTMLPPDGL